MREGGREGRRERDKVLELSDYSREIYMYYMTDMRHVCVG